MYRDRLNRDALQAASHLISGENPATRRANPPPFPFRIRHCTRRLEGTTVMVRNWRARPTFALRRARACTFAWLANRSSAFGGKREVGAPVRVPKILPKSFPEILTTSR